MKKNLNIQILRAIAIMAVIVIHSYGTDAVGLIVRPIVNFAVALFIFIAGYLTTIDDFNFKSLLGKRVKKVLIPYILWTILFSVLYRNFNFVPNLLLGLTPEIYYYIIVYFELTLLTPVFIKAAEKKNKIIFLLSPIALILFTYIPNLIGISYPDVFSRINGLFWIIYYYLGILLGNKKINISLSKRKTYVLIFVFLLLSYGEGGLWYYLANNSKIAFTQLKLSSMLYSLSICILANMFINGEKCKENKFTSFLILIGNYSFGIYLSHVLFISVLKKLPIYNYLIFPINSMLILLINLIFIYFVKKILSPKLCKLIGF